MRVAIQPPELPGLSVARYPVRAILAVRIVRAFRARGPLTLANTCRAVGRDATDGTVRNALHDLMAAERVAYLERGRLYGLAAQIAAVRDRHEQLDRLNDLWFNGTPKPAPGVSASPCRCGGQVVRGELGAVCLQCGHRPGVAT